MCAPCLTLVPDLCPRMRADVSFYTTTVHESQGHAWLNDTWRKTIRDHSCTLLNAKCWRPATQNLSDGQNSFIMPHRDYVNIVAMCILPESEWQTEFMHFYTSQLCLHSRDVYFTTKNRFYCSLRFECFTSSILLAENVYCNMQINSYCSPRFDCVTFPVLLAKTVSLLPFCSLWLFHCYCSPRFKQSKRDWMNNDFNR